MRNKSYSQGYLNEQKHGVISTEPNYNTRCNYKCNNYAPCHNIMFLFVQMTLVTNEDDFQTTKLNAPWEKQDNGDLSGMTYENKQEEDENYSGQSV